MSNRCQLHSSQAFHRHVTSTSLCSLSEVDCHVSPCIAMYRLLCNRWARSRRAAGARPRRASGRRGRIMQHRQPSPPLRVEKTRALHAVKARVRTAGARRAANGLACCVPPPPPVAPVATHDGRRPAIGVPPLTRAQRPRPSRLPWHSGPSGRNTRQPPHSNARACECSAARRRMA